MAVRLRKIPLTLFQHFFRTETIGASILLLFGIAALVLANSPLSERYEQFWQIHLSVGMVGHSLSLTLRQWINDGLMAVFFLLVGLEMKRELLVGELASVKRAVLPIASAIGGMLAPAAIYVACNRTGFGTHGWGIPMATDIAFALGALAVIAPRAPLGAKVFLTVLAIVDDIGAVLVIAVFYSQTLQWVALACAGVAFLVLICFNATRIRAVWPYVLVGLLMWYFMHQSGIHPALAGALVAFSVPMRTPTNALEFSRQGHALLNRFDRTEGGDLPGVTGKRQQEALFALRDATQTVTGPNLRLENSLHKFSAFVVMPLFAFANAGVKLEVSIQHAEIALGVLCGLVIGKPVGITAAAVLAIHSGIAKLPRGVGWNHLVCCACVAGIGFTMSLFIAMLAFDATALLDAAKQGIVAASVIAAIVGAIVIRLTERHDFRIEMH